MRAEIAPATNLIHEKTHRQPMLSLLTSSADVQWYMEPTGSMY